MMFRSFFRFLMEVGYSQSEFSSVKKNPPFFQLPLLWAWHQCKHLCFCLYVSGGTGKARFLSKSKLFSSLRMVCLYTAGLPLSVILFRKCVSLKLSKTDQRSKPPPVRFLQFPRTPTPFLPFDSSPDPKVLHNTIHNR